MAQLNTNDSPLDPEVEQTELDGTKVVVVRRQDGSELYVANTGDAYPLRANDKGTDAGQLDFTEYGADFDIVAPWGTVELSELVWLDAVEKLSANIEKIFADSPTNLTPNAMAALGEQLRGCSSELARIDTPSARLQPVHALVEKACGEYDEGAQCFATAAGIGIPSAGTAADREQPRRSSADSLRRGHHSVGRRPEPRRRDNNGNQLAALNFFTDYDVPPGATSTTAWTTTAACRRQETLTVSNFSRPKRISLLRSEDRSPHEGADHAERRRSCMATQRATVGTLGAALTTAIKER